jgi:hypothetical protein
VLSEPDATADDSDAAMMSSSPDGGDTGQYCSMALLAKVHRTLGGFLGSHLGLEVVCHRTLGGFLGSRLGLEVVCLRTLAGFLGSHLGLEVVCLSTPGGVLC